MQPVRSALNALLISLLLPASTLPIAAQATTVERAGSMAQITVFDRTDGKPLPLYWHQGELWVPGIPGHEFEVKVRNAQGRDMLAVVSVDGVNVVSGETAAPDQTGYVLSGWREYSIQGWRKSLERTAAFYFTPIKDSYAARTGRAGDVGVIGVAVFLRKLPPPPVITAPPISLRGIPQEDGPHMKDSASSAGSNSTRDTLASTQPAPAAPAAAAESAAKSASATLGEQRADSARQESAKLGTGHGRSEYSLVRNVPFERATQSPQETIVIRYDSLANLERRGIVIARAPERSPRAFPAARDPAFVPDPPGF